MTGAAGFIGSRLADRLVDGSNEVRCVDSLTPYYDPALKRQRLDALGSRAGVEVVEADLRTADIVPLLHDVDVVLHLAAQPGVRASWSGFAEYVGHNVLATQRLLDASREITPQRIVFASSSSVYGQMSGAVDEDAPTRPHSPYGVTKLAAESLCLAYARNFAVPVVSLRLFTVYGPGQRPDMAIHRLITAALCGETFPMYGDGSQSRAFTYVDDVVDAVLVAAAAPVAAGSVYNIAGARSATVREVITAVERASGAAVPVDHRGDEAGDVERTDAVIERAAVELGWRPRTSLEAGVAHQVDELRARGSSDRVPR